MFDICSEERLGGGRLQDYLINSNTQGGKFVTNIVQDRPNIIPPEKATGTVLESLQKTDVALELGKYGQNVAPLNDIGKFLVEVGGKVKNLIDLYNESSCCHCFTEVTQLQQSECKQMWKVVSINLKTKMMQETFACQVVLATGGAQKIPRMQPASRNTKVISSDEVCTREGIAVLHSRLKGKDKKKVVIVGGSHSAFSAAWICLNKLDANINAEMQIYILHRSPIKVYYATKREAQKDKYYGYDTPNKCGQIHPFGGLRGDAKALYRSIKTGQEPRIRLLCTGLDGTNHQTMAKKLQDEGHVIIWACGYAANTSMKLLDHLGNHIKLKYDRGQVVVNNEAQVMRASPPTAVTIATQPPSPSTPASPGTRSCRASPLQIDARPVGNLMATGLGFGFVIESGSEEIRADGVAIYLKRGATLILSRLLGTKVFGENISTWEQHVSVNLKRCAMNPSDQQYREQIQDQGLLAGIEDPQVDPGNGDDSLAPLMFDPSSPSNASTAGVGVSRFSPSPKQRLVSTAPQKSRPNTYQRSRTGEVPPPSRGAKSRHAMRQVQGAVAKQGTPRKPVPKTRTTGASGRAQGRREPHQRAAPRSASLQGTSVFGPSSDEQDPPPTTTPRSDDMVQLPKVAPHRPADKTSSERGEVQAVAVERLCQPKSIAAIVRPTDQAVQRVAPKMTSEFIIDLPSPGVLSCRGLKGATSKQGGAWSVSECSPDVLACTNSGTKESPRWCQQRNEDRETVKAWNITSADCNTNEKSQGLSGPPISPIQKQKQSATRRVHSVDGPSVADTLWAEKRSANQRTCDISNAIHASPLGSKRSTHVRTSSGGFRREGAFAQSDGNVSSSLYTSDLERHPKSPLPYSAPARTKAIMSKSLDGPPSHLLTLPVLGEKNTNRCGQFNPLASPLLVVKHEIFRKAD